jgi:hypothetical protein
MTDATDRVAEVLAGLTKAQRDVLTTPHEWAGAEVIMGTHATRQALLRRGLVTSLWTYTPLGIEVRTRLTQEPDNG